MIEESFRLQFNISPKTRTKISPTKNMYVPFCPAFERPNLWSLAIPQRQKSRSITLATRLEVAKRGGCTGLDIEPSRPEPLEE